MNNSTHRSFIDKATDVLLNPTKKVPGNEHPNRRALISGILAVSTFGILHGALGALRYFLNKHPLESESDSLHNIHHISGSALSEEDEIKLLELNNKIYVVQDYIKSYNRQEDRMKLEQLIKMRNHLYY